MPGEKNNSETFETQWSAYWNWYSVDLERASMA